MSRMNLIYSLSFILLIISCGGEDENSWNWDTGIPHYPSPRYHDDEIAFFPRIIGGTPAFLGEFPAKVSVQTRAGHHTCGGALIDLRHVLTAAHCLTTPLGHVLNLNEIRLMANDLSIDQRNAHSNRQIRFPSHFFVHPEFNAETFANDIAVIRTSVPFYRTPTLHAFPRAIETPQVGDVCALAGWGVTHEIRVRPHPILLRVDLDIIDMNFCNGSSSFNGRIPANFLCAGSMDGSRDACFGDSGGGLMCHNQIAGIVSFGFGCGRRNFPGAYVDVSRYNNWISECINSNIEHENIPTPSTLSPSASSYTKLDKILFFVHVVISLAWFQK